MHTQGIANCGPCAKSSPPPARARQTLLKCGCVNSLVSSVAAFIQQPHSWTTAMKNQQPAELKIFALWSCSEGVCQSLASLIPLRIHWPGQGPVGKWNMALGALSWSEHSPGNDKDSFLHHNTPEQVIILAPSNLIPCPISSCVSPRVSSSVSSRQMFAHICHRAKLSVSQRVDTNTAMT